MALYTPRRVMTHNLQVAQQYVGEMQVRPKGCPSLLLGTYDQGSEPIGFRILVHPNPKPAGSIATRVSRVSAPDNKYKLILHVMNSGSRTVGIEAYELLKTTHILDLRKTSRLPDQASTNSETVLSGGGEPVGSLTTEKQFVDGDGRSGGAGILRKSSIVASSPQSGSARPKAVSLGARSGFSFGH
jgi:hypothetical protein